jgi:cyclic-di-AMP phosphodiesterase PgpH
VIGERVDTVFRPSSLVAPRLVPRRTTLFVFLANTVGLIALLVFLFTAQPDTAAMRVGEVAGESVVAQHAATYPDLAATKARRAQVMASVPPIYRNSRHLASIRRMQAEMFLSRVAPILTTHAVAQKKLIEVRRLLPAGVQRDSIETLATLSPSDFRIVQQHSLSLLTQASYLHFNSSHSENAEIGLLSTISARVSLPQRTAIEEVLQAFLTPTRVTDTRATQAKRLARARSVPRVTRPIYPGEVIVRRGDLVTPVVMAQLSALGLQGRHAGWPEVTASLLFSAMIILMLFWYLHAFHGGIVTNPRLLLLVDASIVGTVVGARLLGAGHVLLPYFLPVAAAPTFAAVLFAPEACIAVALSMAVLAGWIATSSFELTMYYFVTGAAGVLAIRQVRQVKQFIFAGAYIALFALATVLAFGLVEHNYDLNALQEYVLAAGLNGFVSASLALGGFALLSGFFGVTTSLQLLELSQPNHPLLRRLTIRAPGTHNHSLILASMVERAAEEVGADSLVAKVGALYHDVGKTTNPHCFVENQLGIGNIHDELRAEESARIIRGHVTQGLRLARQHRLPRVVLDAIAEHHGTMTINYFLHKGIQESGEGVVDTSLYTYAGPKPQSKETALLLLADGCESAVRASHDHSPANIRDIVHRIFQERIEQGQLDECPLTLHDLDLVRAAFASVLNGLYHPRIEYPEPIDLAVDRSVRSQLRGVPESNEQA